MSLTPLPLQPRKVHLWRKVFALPAVNGPLPAELNFRENIGLLSFFFFNCEHLFIDKSMFITKPAVASY